MQDDIKEIRDVCFPEKRCARSTGRVITVCDTGPQIGWLVSHQLSSVQNPGWLFYIEDYTTQLYISELIISHYRDPH